MNVKMAVVGGGSVNWMRGLMRDIYLMDGVDGGEIRLVDPQTETVQAVADMLNTFNELRGKEFAISIVEDRKEALDGVDFCLTTFSPGTMDAFYNDLEVPIRYGIRQPVSMTVGPCGVSAALRTAPVAYEIVQDMEEMCPGAWLLNVTNPMSVVTRALNAAAKTVKVVGMCHEFHAFPHYVGELIDMPKPEGMHTLDYLYRWLPEQGFDYTVAGVNHFIWLTKAELNGKDMIPMIRSYCDEHWHRMPEDEVNNLSEWQNRTQAAKMAYCRQFGYMPLAGDRHLVEFWPHFCNARNGWGMKYNVIKTTVDSRRHAKEKQLATIRAIAAGTEEVDWTQSPEEMTEIIKAVVNKRETTAIVNMPNAGQISNMPEGVVVETLATVSADGVKPKASGDLPGAVGSLCRLHADVHELTFAAAMEGSRDKFIQALSLDPLAAGADFSEIPALADELLMANKQWLPRFFEEK